MVIDHEFLLQKNHNSTKKMLNPVANEATRASKSCDYMLKMNLVEIITKYQFSAASIKYIN